MISRAASSIQLTVLNQECFFDLAAAPSVCRVTALTFARQSARLAFPWDID
jgi:hypothetical protein